MNGKNYALLLGSNKYIHDKYRIFYEKDGKAGLYEPYLTLENTNHGLVLTADIYLRYNERAATVEKNKTSVLDDNYYWTGAIENGEGLKLIEKSTNQVKFNVFITNEGDACVTGTLILEKMRLYITRDFIKIDNIVDKSTDTEPHAEDNWMHHMTYRGIGDFVVGHDSFSIMARNLPI